METEVRPNPITCCFFFSSYYTELSTAACGTATSLYSGPSTCSSPRECFKSTGAMDKDFKDVGSGDDTSECYIITISERRRRIVWCAVLVVCVCGECVVRVWLCGVLLCGCVCCCCWYVCVWCCVLGCAAASPYFDEFLKHFGERQPQELVCWWIRTTTCNKDSDDSLCGHLRLE